MIKVLLADDHAIVRDGVKQLIALTLDIEVTAEAASGEQVLRQLLDKKVDVVLLDINMPPPSGVELIEQIRQIKPDMPVLIFSMHNEMHIVSNVLSVGATGYCSKSSDPKLLLDALRKVYAGQIYLDSQISESLALASAFPELLEPHTLLSRRERQVLVMLAEGQNINTISEQLGISNKTVSSHKANLMDKMKFASIAELVRYAGEHGLVT